MGKNKIQRNWQNRVSMTKRDKAKTKYNMHTVN